VRPGDRIVSVNGVQGSFRLMLTEFDGEGIFRVVMLRGSLEDYIGLEEYRAAQKSANRLPPELLDFFPTGRAEDFGDWSRIPARFFGGAHDSCCICLEDFEANATVLRLPCGHVLHQCCAKQWLTEGRGVCPLCCSPVAGMLSPLSESTCPGSPTTSSTSSDISTRQRISL